MQSSHERIVDIGQKVDETHLRHQEDETQKIILWLSTLSFREQHVAILESVQPGTGGWFTKHETFRAWLEGKIRMLWCPGLRKFTDLSGQRMRLSGQRMRIVTVVY